MAKIASVVFSLALMVLSIQFVAQGIDSKMDQEKEFYKGIEIAVCESIPNKDNLRSDLRKVDFHQAYADAKSKESNDKSVFVETYINTMVMLYRNGAYDSSDLENIFSGKEGSLAPEIKSDVVKIYEEYAKHHESGNTKHDL